jgi:hypothetical protein
MLDKKKVTKNCSDAEKLKKTCKKKDKKMSLRTCRESPIEGSRKIITRLGSCDNWKKQEKKKKVEKKVNMKKLKQSKRFEKKEIGNIVVSPIKKVTQRFFNLDESSILNVLEILTAK